MNLYLGRTWVCQVVKLEGRFALLDPAPKGLKSPPAQWLPLPMSEAPAGLQVGQALEVFVYLDTHDQPAATTLRPFVRPGEAAFLRVVDSTPFGYFVDWGLPRDLFIPFKETLGPMDVGDLYAISPYIDDTERLAGTCKLAGLLEPGEYEPGERVEGVAWRREVDVGTFVILEKNSLALLPASEPNRLKPGEKALFRISKRQPDGKIEVSLRGLAHEELDKDADRLLLVLKDPHGPRLGDYSDPELIHARLGISKKAFKRAAGQLLKRGLIWIDDESHYHIKTQGAAQTPSARARKPQTAGSRGGMSSTVLSQPSAHHAPDPGGSEGQRQTAAPRPPAAPRREAARHVAPREEDSRPKRREFVPATPRRRGNSDR